MPTSKKMWRCPKCGHAFVTRNLWHSCVRVPLAAHFKGKPPERRETWDAWLAAARAAGTVTAYAQKSRIIIMASVRFAGVSVYQGHLKAHIWLRRRITHPRLTKTESFGNLGYGHTFRLEKPSDIDDAIRAFMKEAYR